MNVSGSNTSQLPEADFRNGWGYVYLLQLFYLIPYVPCMVVICGKELRAHTSFKIMGVMGLIDILMIILGSAVLGFCSILGIGAHNYPIEHKIIGGICNGLWYTYAMLNVVLALNRGIELGTPDIARLLFNGNKVWIWVTLCIAEGVTCFALFSSPLAGVEYHSGYAVFLFDFLGESYGLLINTVHNFMIGLILPVLYFIAWVAFRMRTSGATDRSGGLDDKERRLVTQVSLLSLFVFLVCLTYVTVPYITNNIAIYPLINIFWQWMQGSNAFIYLGVNKTIRKNVLQIIGWKSAAVAP